MMRSLFYITFIPILLFLHLSVNPASAATIHIPADQPTIQAGIDASVNGDTVLVAPGTYFENIDFSGKAITVRSDLDGLPETHDLGMEQTIIDGGGVSTVVLFVSGETGASVLEGFTITNGSGLYFPESEESVGGGIFCHASSPSIQHCTVTANNATRGGGLFFMLSFVTITDCSIVLNTSQWGGGIYSAQSSLSISDTHIGINTTTHEGGGVLLLSDTSTITNCSVSENSTTPYGNGGGIYCGSYSDPVITNCTFSGNIASDNGGGIYCSRSDPEIANCTFSGNHASDHGGGIYCGFYSDPEITNCTFSGNHAGDYGGGIFCYSYSNPAIANCTFSGNHASDHGGGIYCGLHSHPEITNCTFSGNHASDYGGGIYCYYDSNPAIANCTFTGNNADYLGGGIFCDDSSPWISHCTFTGNIAGYKGGGIFCYYSYPRITNCILWGDYATTGAEIYISVASPTVRYSDVEGGWPGTGNIDSDPLFASEEDFHITADSPCINAGTDIEVYTDIDSDIRPFYGGFDIGADEYTGDCWDHDHDGYDDSRCGGDDCDDGDSEIFPGAEEFCNQLDDDCDSFVDEDFDEDGDGFSICAEPIPDCNDSNPNVNPGVHEIPGNGVDDDCDGQTDECMILRIPDDQPTIQAAIDASEDCDTVLVGPGTYFENINFNGKAITIESETGPTDTIIDGNQVGSVVTIESGEGGHTILDGFTIRNGTSTYGGGIYCRDSYPTILNCTFSSNSVDIRGGGIYCHISSPAIANCTFTGNTANFYGGGIYCFDSDIVISDCKFTENSAYNDGGGICCFDSYIVISDCKFAENSAYDDGGGTYFSNSNPEITNCTFSNNSADNRGGGIYCYGYPDPVITNCTFSGNSAHVHGGGIYNRYNNLVVTNCTFAGNRADGSGGGIYFGNSDSYPVITNCILWGDSATSEPEIYIESGSPSVTYSDVQGGWPGEGNIDSDPRFVGSGNYHLLPSSPCIDAGTDAGLTVDMDGDVRPQGAGFDMGADEYVPGPCFIDTVLF